MKPVLAHFREGYERASLPLGRLCLRARLTPDALTLISLLLGGVAAYVISQGALLSGVAFILLMSAADVLDGATARAGGTANPFGTVFDHTVDRYVEFLLFLGVMLSGYVGAGWAVFALFGMVMASYVRARAEATGLVASCNVGFAGRQEKLGLLLVGLVLQPFFSELRLLEWAVIGVGFASHITALQRLLYTRRIILGASERKRWSKRQGAA